ncbi:MAG TPA: TIGR01777 family oxidoreductase [Anaerolineae bacterium]|nr:TIGR01777 family oxidoreductase [Anaerolineae bacterium]
MRVIITGGAGLIGRALATSLAADQHEVIVLTREPENTVRLPPGVRAQQWDARTANGWGRLADGADAIVNLAGENFAGTNLFEIFFKRWTSRRKQRILDSRVHAGQAVVAAIEAARRKPRVLIQAAAVGYYGTLRDEELTEDMPRGNDFLARVVWDWANSTLPVEMLGVRRVVTRSGVVLSGKGGILSVMLLPFKFFVGGKLGRGRQWFSWIHIEDEIRAMRFLIDTPAAKGAFNLTAPQPIRNAELAKTIGRVVRRPSFFPTPGLLLRLMLGEKSVVVLEGQRPIPRRLLDLGFTFRFPEVESALRDLLKKRSHG